MNTERLQQLLTFSYWFSYYPEPFAGGLYWAVLGTAGGAAVTGLVLTVATRWVQDAGWRRVVSRLASLLLTLGCLALLSFFFTQTSTPLLGSRFWFLLWFIIGLVWLLFIAWYAVRQAPAERAARRKQQEYQKYLPR